MATLKAMFKLFDGYSSTIDKVSRKTDEATNKILKASGQTDNFNNKLNATGTSASRASGGLGKFLSIAGAIAGAVKGMSIADEYMNTSARLNMINDGLQTQAELQDKIFAAANRSKGSYTDMASAISKMGLMAKESFGSNNELIAFTELMQKSFKVGGASQSEQSSAMLQLTQAMGAGKLQGDEFRSIMENAPMIADAIAKYTGKSKGELKEMSSEGLITADIIKNAMFMAGDEINEKFKTMPLTYADVWNRIKNEGLRAFDGVITKVNELINTNGFQDFLSGVIVGFDILASTVSWVIDTIIAGWNVIGPILGLITGLYLTSMIIKLWAMVPPLMAQAVAWLVVYWPILLIIAVIAIAVSAARQFGASWSEILGFVGGMLGVFATFAYNKFIFIWNIVAAFINFFGNAFNHPVASVKALFYDLAANVIGYVTTMARAIQAVINEIPGVEINITSGLDGMKSKLEKAADTVRSRAGLIEYVKSKDFMEYSEGIAKGSKLGNGAYDKLSGSISGLADSFTGTGKDTGIGGKYGVPGLGAGKEPTKVKGTGSNGAVKVDMSDEDLQYLRDIAEREYINKFSTATLAPSIQVNFGDVHKEADANKVAGRIKKILREEIAMAAEGAY